MSLKYILFNKFYIVLFHIFQLRALFMSDYLGSYEFRRGAGQKSLAYFGNPTLIPNSDPHQSVCLSILSFFMADRSPV
jgi:hypothetical protein